MKGHFLNRPTSFAQGTYEGLYESNASSFFSGSEIAITVKFTWMIHTSFAIMGLFFHNVSIICNTLLPTLNKTLYTSVVKFPASTSEHITGGTRKLYTNCNSASVVFVVTET
jgi:hypothetical protein